MKKALVTFAIALSLFMGASGATAAGEEVVVSDEAIGRSVGGFSLVDQDGKAFYIKDILEGKPLVISYIYTGCAHICPTILTNLQGAFEKAQDGLGKDFTALTIGFDTKNDTPGVLKNYGKSFTKDFGSWRFATGSPEEIKNLTRELGFFYRESPEGGFDHLNLVTIVDSRGKVFAQVHGLDFTAREVLDPVYASIRGAAPPPSKPIGLIERVKLFCYRYDEKTGVYRLDYGAVATLSVVSFLQLATAGWMLRVILRKR